MPTLTVRNLEEELVKRLRLRAAEHGRSAEAEHRAILRDVLLGPAQPPGRAEVAARLAAFRRRVAGRGGPDATALLREARGGRLAALGDAGEPEG